MKTWRIPVVWQMMGVVEVVADTLEEAMKIAKDDDNIPLPDNGEYLDDSWEVATNDVDSIRDIYNRNQEDEAPVKEDPKIAYWRPLKVYPDEATCSNCGELRPESGADVCPGCGYSIRN